MNLWVEDNSPITDAPASASTLDMENWQHVKRRLSSEFGEAACRQWIEPLELMPRGNSHEIALKAPNRISRDWVNQHYQDHIRSYWRSLDATIYAISISMDARITAPAPAANITPRALGLGLAVPQDNHGAEPRIERATDAAQSGENWLALGAQLDPRFTFDNFVVGKPNELAFAAARRVTESPEPQFNPLFLYGGVGLGKTHLMHAIAHDIRRRSPDRKVLYLSAEQFMYRFIRALRYKDTLAFKEQFRSVDVLMIDDVQFISGKDSTQEEFFHTFNALVDNNRQIIISADKSPSDLEGLEERLRTRLGWGMVADLHPTSFELRLGIIDAKAEQMGVAVPQKVKEFLAQKITSNVRELEGALNRILAHADLVGRQISLESAQDVLQDMLRANIRRISIDEIQRRVADHYNIRLADMNSARRSRAIARPRQVAMYLAKQLTQRSLPEIGRKFGGKDHTTVMHAVRRIEELVAADASMAEDVDLLRRLLLS